MIAVVDYGMGNLGNVVRAVKFCGGKPKIISTPEEIKRSKKIILPGVGAFPDAVKELKKKKMWDALIQAASDGKPFMGVCLGYQLLFSSSVEGGRKVKGLNLIPGEVKKFPVASFKKKKLKVPQMGWNQIEIAKRSKVLKGIKTNSFFYFVHSFYPEVKKKADILAKTNYGKKFVSAVQRKNIMGFQFHPEKSQDAGLQILKNFIAL